MWSIKSILIAKLGNTGEASITLEDDDETTLILNKFLIDLNDGNSPVKVIKYQGTSIISGSLIPLLYDQILELWNENIKELGNGLYEVTSKGIFDVGDK